ncbi:hypothetical protein EDB19DRAFT_1875935 [Suillus lakei]|nr:hypothetical protein EDB19DRAFT_1875935 [Suillus lakei]
MANASTAGATAPKTPPQGVNSELKSTPLAVGSAAVSEHISTVGVKVKNVSPWIGRDVEDYRECPVDGMLQELLYRCRDRSKPLPDKSRLLNDSLKAVLPICNEGNDAQVIKKNMAELVKSKVEANMYKPFIQATNCALDRLSKLNAPGLVSAEAHDDYKILFHQNDPKFISQRHQGKKSDRKPDVVVISHTCAKKVQKGEPKDAYKDAWRKPTKNFKWTDVRSTVEFKWTKSKLPQPPATHAVKAYDVPDAKQYMKYQRETNDTAEPTAATPAATPLPVGGAATSSHQTSDARGRSNQSGQVNNKKRASTQQPDGHSSKKNKSNCTQPDEEPDMIHPVIQNGLYASEMFAAHIAQQSVISYVVENDIIYIWYFDRQDAIQCSGINFVQDLPRFMVLLLAIQRMPYAEWGYNRLFEPRPGSSGQVRVPDKHIGEVDLTFDLESDKRTTHFGLRGRATTVFPVKSEKLSALVPNLPHHNPHNPTDELVAKLYWPEEERESEAEILQKVYEIAKDEESKVRHHVPEMVWFHKFEDTSTANIRRALGLKDAERGRRILYIIVFRKLDPITKLSDKKFLAAWWHIVVCHYTLWNKGVYHRDISPSNLMVYKTSDGRYIGVLNDFDLSSTQDSPSGRERTGTVPFMALELLTKDAIEGKVKHLYQHDAESLIWVLTWVCLRYRNGRLLRKGRPFDEWLKMDVNGCREKKNDFLNAGRRKIKPTRSHKLNWRVARYCLRPVALFYADDPEFGDPESGDSEMDDSEVDDSSEAGDSEANDSEADDSEAEDSEDSEADDHVSDYLTDAVVFETWLQKNIPRRYRLPKLLVVPV